MTSDVTFRSLKQLPALSPDAARSARVAARCRERLARRQLVKSSPRGRTAFLLEGTVMGFCMVYLCAVIANALKAHAVF